MNILEVRNLKVYFRKKPSLVKAIDGIKINLQEGSITALAGESGCGKTTLARTLLGFYEPEDGSVTFKGVDITLRKNQRVIREHMQIVFQNPIASVDPRYTVFATLKESLNTRGLTNKRQIKETIAEALREVELGEELLSRYPHELSGGQVQRVCIARALINKPSLVILDEPTSSLDIVTAVKIITLLKKLQKDLALTFLFISHNLKLLKNISDYCYIMHEGKIVEHGTKEDIYTKPSHPYTKKLLAAAYHTSILASDKA